MSPDRVIPGQVVSADSDDDEAAQPQETFLHKVASGPAGPVSASMAGRHARTVGGDGAELPDTEDDTEVIPPATQANYTARANGTALTDDPAQVDDTAQTEDPSETDAAAPYTAGPATAGLATADTDTAVPAVADDADVVDDVDDVADSDLADASYGTPAADNTTVAQTRTDMPLVQAKPDVPADADEPLLGETAGLMQEEWRRVQASFVDDPRASVTAAAGVVADAAARLESLLRERQRSLRGVLDANGQADTETLRQLMLTYRTLLTKLISC